MKTIIVALIAFLITFLVFKKIIKDAKKNKNLCGKECCKCNTISNCNIGKK